MLSESNVLYLAGPMTGLPEFNRPAFHEAAYRLRCAGFTVLNPADAEQLNPTPGIPQTWNWYMRHALRSLVDAEGVALLPGWAESRGARLEVRVAEVLEMRLWSVDMWLESAARYTEGRKV